MAPSNQQKPLELLNALRVLNSSQNKTILVNEFDKLLPNLTKKHIQRIKTILIKNKIITTQCKGIQRGQSWTITYCCIVEPNIHMSEQTFEEVRKLIAGYKRNSYMRKKGKQTYTSDWLLEQIKAIKHTFESNNTTMIVDVSVNFLSVQKHKI